MPPKKYFHQYRLVDVNANEFSLVLPANSILGDLRQEVWRKTGVPWFQDDTCSCQNLFFQDQKLSNDPKEILRLQYGDTIHLVEDKSRLAKLALKTYIQAATGFAERLGKVEETLKFLIENTDEDINERTASEQPETLLSMAYFSTKKYFPIAELLIGVGINLDQEKWALSPFFLPYTYEHLLTLQKPPVCKHVLKLQKPPGSTNEEGFNDVENMCMFLEQENCFHGNSKPCHHERNAKHQCPVVRKIAADHLRSVNRDLGR